MNLGTVAFWVFLYFCKIIFVFLVLWPAQKCCISIKPYYLKYKNQLFFSDLLVILLEANIEFLLMFTLYDQTPKHNVDYNIINEIISKSLIVIVALILPLCIIYVVVQPKETLLNEDY